MKGTFRFEVREHSISHLYYSLVINLEGQPNLWIINDNIPVLKNKRKLAFQISNATNDPQYAETDYINAHTVNKGNDYTIWDEGQFQIETKNKIKILLRAEGTKFRGLYMLLNPAWGRWTKRKIWILEKLHV